MKYRVLIFLFSCFMGILAYYSIMQFEDSTKKSSATILQSPFHLNILPLTFNNETPTIYFSKVEKNKQAQEPFELLAFIIAMSPILAAIFIFIMVIFFILTKVNLDHQQYLFLSLSFYGLLYLISFIDYLTLNKFVFLFYFLGFSISTPFIYFFRSLLDRHTPFWFFLWSNLFFIFLTFKLYPTESSSEIFLLKLIAISQFLTLLYSFSLLITYLARIKQDKNKINTTRLVIIKTISALIFIVSFFTPSIVFSILTYFDVSTNANYNAFFFLPAFSIGLHTMFGIRFGLIFIKIVIHEFLFKILIIFFFALLYLFFTGFRLYSLFDTETGLFFHLTIVCLSLIILDPIRTSITFFLDQSSVKRNVILGEYLSEITYYFNNPDNILTFFNRLSKAIEKGLEIHQIKFFFAKDILPNLTLHANNIFYTNFVWKAVRKKKMIFFYPIFTKEKIKKWGDLFQNKKDFLFIAFQKFDAAILISNKTNKKAFFSSDIKFLRTIIKYSEALLQNYHAILETTKIHRHENELALAASIQKKILPSEYEDNRIKLCFIIKPFEKVTGDYIDFFKKTINEYIIFLGDVSGHGLGSAYLMTVTHSIIHSSIKILGEKLSRTFIKVNRYLVHDYAGHDFMSLVGLKIKTMKDDKINNGKEYAKLQFINAGQHPVLIYLMESKKIITLSTNQRVLGVVDNEYKISTYLAYENFRIFIYSDGIFEIFNQEGKIIGEKEVYGWISDSSHLEIGAQKKIIEDILEKHQQEKKFIIMDDISLVIAEITLQN